MTNPARRSQGPASSRIPAPTVQADQSNTDRLIAERLQRRLAEGFESVPASPR